MKIGGLGQATSSMMFRKEVLTALFTTEIREHKNSVDTYLATGSNFLGGTLAYTKPLTQRLIHSKNDYRTQSNISARRAARSLIICFMKSMTVLLY